MRAAAARARWTSAALRAALDAIVARHEALRTDLRRPAGGQPVQVDRAAGRAGAAGRATWPGCRRPRARRRRGARRGDEAARPFDLARARCCGRALLRLGPDEHVLLLTLHHIVADGWSLGVLVRELARALPRPRWRRPRAGLPPLPVQYADYAVWQRQLAAAARCSSGQLAYWRAQLAGAPAALELPTDARGPPVQSFRGATQAFALPAELAGRAARRWPSARARRSFMVAAGRLPALLAPLQRAGATSWSAPRSPAAAGASWRG